MRKPSGFPTWSDTNRAVQPQKMARGLKFQIKVVEGLYYPYCENKGADQLRGYREADLRLCFRICKKWFSHDAAHIISLVSAVKISSAKQVSIATQAGLCLTWLETLNTDFLYRRLVHN